MFWIQSFVEGTVAQKYMYLPHDVWFSGVIGWLLITYIGLYVYV